MIPKYSIVVVTGILLVTPAIHAERFYGNGNFTWQSVEQTVSDSVGEIADNSNQQQLNVGYEDDLFTKNILRVTANFTRREYPFTDYAEYRPIFYIDITSFGYSLNASYSPYKRLAVDPSGTSTFYQYYRDFRGSAGFTFDKYPTVSATYSRNRTFEHDPDRQNEATSTSTVLQTSYSVRSISTQWAYNQQDVHYDSLLAPEISTKSLNAATSWTGISDRLGNANITYALFGARRYSNGLMSRESVTNSLGLFYNMPPISTLGGTFSYSGRFVTSEQSQIQVNTTSENFAGQLSWSPLGYLVTDLTKGYQLSREAGNHQITEYTALGGTLTRYLRHGVDTRLSYTHTAFQQSNRAEIRRELGLPEDKGRYSLDTWSGAVSTAAINYARVYVDATLTRDGDPIAESERYQMRSAVDLRLSATRTLEGRIGYSTSYQGSKIRLGHAFANTYNIGASWIPRGNLNINVTYIYTSFNAIPKITSEAFSVYASYNFRRAFTLNVAVNNQEQKLITSTLLPEVRQPRSVNAQLLAYLSPRTTLSVSLLDARTSLTETVAATRNRTVQLTVNTNW